MVSNIGASTQEGSLLRSNISSICAVEGKRTYHSEVSVRFNITPSRWVISSNKNITSSGVNVG